MMTFNEEYELVVLNALVANNLAMADKIAEYEMYPKHCEYWCNEKKKAQAALDAADRYFKLKDSK